MAPDLSASNLLNSCQQKQDKTETRQKVKGINQKVILKLAELQFTETRQKGKG